MTTRRPTQVQELVEDFGGAPRCSLIGGGRSGGRVVTYAGD